MVLSFGLIGGGDTTLQTADYRTAGSHQSENLKYLSNTALNTWTTIYTVPVGKTFYISGIIIVSGSAGENYKIATGDAGSESTFMTTNQGSTTNSLVLQFNLSTPLKIPSGTRLSFRASTAENSHVSLLGWEEWKYLKLIMAKEKQGL